MGTTLAQAYVQVIPTTKGIKGMLGKELGNEGDSGGKTTGMKFTGAFKKAIVAAGIGTALAKTISEGAKLEQSIGGVETLFGKKDAETVKRNAQNAYKTLQISANDYMEQATSFSAALLQSLNGDTKKAAAAEDADLRYVNIDFSKIDKAWLQEFYAQSGIIKDLVIGDSTVTGHLVGVTISGDLLEGNTVKADKLVVKGEDGLYYKLNIEGGSTVTPQLTKEMLQNGLDGSNIIANTITAEKIKVDDLIAFDATIGGFNIASNAIYSGVKSSVDNTTRGMYLGADGQMNFGDSNNYIKYHKDEKTGKYALEIMADHMIFGSTGTNVQDAIEDLRDEITTLLRIESSRGTVFKNDHVETVLSVVIYHGKKRITNATELSEAFGSGAYLQWKWQRLDDDSFGIIASADLRFGNDGFTFTLKPEDVDTKVTFMCELIV